MAVLKSHRFRSSILFIAALLANAHVAIASNLLTVDVTANDLAYSPVTGLMYAAVPNSSALNPNTLLPINPHTGALGTPIPIGFDPQAVVASSDGNNLFASIGGRLAVQRYHIPTAILDQFFAMSGGARVEQLRAVPDRPNAVMLHRYNLNFNTSEGTVVYENAVALPKHIAGGNLNAIDPTDGTKGYLYNSRSSSFDHAPLKIGPEGVEINGTSPLQGVIHTGLSRIEIAGDRLFCSCGGIYSLSLGIQVGSFPNVDSFLVDTESQKFYVHTATESTKTITTYSLATLAQIDVDIFQIAGGVGPVLRKFASNGLAFRTDPGKVAFVTLTDGDYNKNGVVDIADYTLWRDTVGKSGIGLAADGNGNNEIDAGDYEFWLAQFGETVGSGSSLDSASLASSVPEPTAIALSAIGVLATIVAFWTRHLRR